MNKREFEELQKEYQEKLYECQIYDDIMKLLNKIDTIVYLSLILVSLEYYICHTAYSFVFVIGFLMYKTHVAETQYESKRSYLKGCMIEIEKKFDKYKLDDK